MRHMMTFIVRLWVDAQSDPPTWEGQIECLANNEREHIHTPAELLAFIAAHTCTWTKEGLVNDNLKHTR